MNDKDTMIKRSKTLFTSGLIAFLIIILIVFLSVVIRVNLCDNNLKQIILEYEELSNIISEKSTMKEYDYNKQILNLEYTLFNIHKLKSKKTKIIKYIDYNKLLSDSNLDYLESCFLKCHNRLTSCYENYSYICPPSTINNYNLECHYFINSISAYYDNEIEEANEWFKLSNYQPKEIIFYINQ